MSFLKTKWNQLWGSRNNATADSFENSSSHSGRKPSTSITDSGFFSVNGLIGGSLNKRGHPYTESSYRSKTRDHYGGSLRVNSTSVIDENVPSKHLVHKMASQTLRSFSNTIRSSAQLFYVTPPQSEDPTVESLGLDVKVPDLKYQCARRTSGQRPTILPSSKRRTSSHITISRSEPLITVKQEVILPHELEVEIPDSHLLELRQSHYLTSALNNIIESYPNSMFRGLKEGWPSPASVAMAKPLLVNDTLESYRCEKNEQLPAILVKRSSPPCGFVFAKGHRKFRSAPDVVSPFCRATSSDTCISSANGGIEEVRCGLKQSNKLQCPKAQFELSGEELSSPSMGSRHSWEIHRAARRSRYEEVMNSDKWENELLPKHHRNQQVLETKSLPMQPQDSKKVHFQDSDISSSALLHYLKAIEAIKDAEEIVMSIPAFHYIVEDVDRKDTQIPEDSRNDLPTPLYHSEDGFKALEVSCDKTPCRNSSTFDSPLRRKDDTNEELARSPILKPSSITFNSMPFHNTNEIHDAASRGISCSDPCETQYDVPLSVPSKEFRASSAQSNATTDSCALTTHSPLCYQPMVSSHHTRTTPVRRTSSIIDALHEALEHTEPGTSLEARIPSDCIACESDREILSGERTAFEMQFMRSPDSSFFPNPAHTERSLAINLLPHVENDQGDFCGADSTTAGPDKIAGSENLLAPVTPIIEPLKIDVSMNEYFPALPPSCDTPYHNIDASSVPNDDDSSSDSSSPEGISIVLPLQDLEVMKSDGSGRDTEQKHKRESSFTFSFKRPLKKEPRAETPEEMGKSTYIANGKSSSIPEWNLLDSRKISRKMSYEFKGNEQISYDSEEVSRTAFPPSIKNKNTFWKPEGNIHGKPSPALSEDAGVKVNVNRTADLEVSSDSSKDASGSAKNTTASSNAPSMDTRFKSSSKAACEVENRTSSNTANWWKSIDDFTPRTPTKPRYYNNKAQVSNRAHLIFGG